MLFSSSGVPDSLWPYGLQHAGFPVLHKPGSLLRLVFIELAMLFNHFILYCPLLLPPSIFPGIRVFSSALALRIRWPKYWSFIFSVSLSNEYSVLISFRIETYEQHERRMAKGITRGVTIRSGHEEGVTIKSVGFVFKTFSIIKDYYFNKKKKNYAIIKRKFYH